MTFLLFIALFIAQRISEIFIAKRNEDWLRKKGAIEYGQQHYPFIVALHVLFIASIIAEYAVKPAEIDLLFLGIFILLLVLKIWTISSLGKFWNTKIFRIPGMSPVTKGPYKYLRHPNYLIVVCEFIVVPMVFHLVYTAIIFSILNAAMLKIRIREEEKIWMLTIGDEPAGNISP